MSREAIIETVARAIDPAVWNTRVMESIPDYKGRRDVSKYRARAAIAALEAATPGLSDLIEGRAVVMPLEATGAMESALAKLKPSDCSLRQAYNAMVAASPYRRKT